jgi:CopG family transcriptional regulator/antitoxin EndoAI
VSESREMQEVVISLPQNLMLEVEGIIQQEEINQDEFFHQAVKWYLRERKQKQIRESMRRGYMEMAKINLSIASEAFQAEDEAETTVEKLVSGG